MKEPLIISGSFLKSDMKEILIDAGTKDQRLDKFLKRYFKNAPAGFVYKMLRKKNIVLNDHKADGTELLAEGDSVKLYFADDTLISLSGENSTVSYPGLDPSRIIYEDENILLYNKEAGLLTQSSGKESISLCEMLIGYMSDKGEVSEESLKLYRPSAVNRLDRNTTGIVICAKTYASARELSEMIRTHTLKKEYLCVCKGRIKHKITLSGSIEKDKKLNTVHFTDSPDALNVLTYITPAAYDADIDASLVIASLETGRTHQIRASLANAGYPVAGDTKYGEKGFNSIITKKTGRSYQMLHSYKLTFPKIEEGVLSYLSEKVFLSVPDFRGLFSEQINKL